MSCDKTQRMRIKKIHIFSLTLNALLLKTNRHSIEQLSSLMFLYEMLLYFFSYAYHIHIVYLFIFSNNIIHLKNHLMAICRHQLFSYSFFFIVIFNVFIFRSRMDILQALTIFYVLIHYHFSFSFCFFAEIIFVFEVVRYQKIALSCSQNKSICLTLPLLRSFFSQ